MLSTKLGIVWYFFGLFIIHNILLPPPLTPTTSSPQFSISIMATRITPKFTSPTNRVRTILNFWLPATSGDLQLPQNHHMEPPLWLQIDTGLHTSISSFIIVLTIVVTFITSTRIRMSIWVSHVDGSSDIRIASSSHVDGGGGGMIHILWNRNDDTASG